MPPVRLGHRSSQRVRKGWWYVLVGFALVALVTVAVDDRLYRALDRPVSDVSVSDQMGSFGVLLAPAALAALLLTAQRARWRTRVPAAVLLVPLTLAVAFATVALRPPEPPCPILGTCAEDIAAVPDATAVAVHLAGPWFPACCSGWLRVSRSGRRRDLGAGPSGTRTKVWAWAGTVSSAEPRAAQAG